jgi:hypothetical protein
MFLRRGQVTAKVLPVGKDSLTYKWRCGDG